MCTRKSTAARLLGLACAAGWCLGATYTWNGGGADDRWDNDDNWSCTCLGYPDSSAHDAIIDGTYDVDLVDVQIDDLTVSGTVTLGDADGDDPVLDLESLTVAGDSSVELTEGATVITTQR